MMKLKRFAALILAVLLTAGIMTACGGENGSGLVNYRVSVVDAKGAPYTSGIIVRFLKGGEQVSMQVVDGNGIAAKELEKGEYTVELMFTDSDVQYAYDTSDLTLTPAKNELTISLAYATTGRSMEMYTGEKALIGWFVDACCTQVQLTKGERNYFLFAPTEAGTYEISAIGEVAGIGLYGTPYYVMDTSIELVENNAFTVSIRADQIGSGEGGTTVLVIGIDADDSEECILSVERIGDPAWTEEDVPYVVYQPSIELVPYTLPEDAVLEDFDLTASTETYELVLDANGFYHLNDENGPLVLVKLGVDNKYTASYSTMMTKTGIRAYFYDENGEFLRREDYYECLVKYAGHTDSNSGTPVVTKGVMDEEAGVYPLTEDLKYIIQNHGRHSGWFNLDEERSIFQDNNGMPIPDINEEIAWLFMCVYIAQ